MPSEKQMLEALKRNFAAAAFDIGLTAPQTVEISIRPSSIVEVCSDLYGQGGRFVVSIATDRIAQSDQLEVVHVFSFDKDSLTVLVKTRIGFSNPSLPSITPAVPPANWAERECRDLMGIEFIGHPDPRRLVLADDWPKGVYPLRKSFPYDHKPASAPENEVPLKSPSPPASVLPLGPIHPALHEPSYFRLFVDGEKIVGSDHRGFYSHRGIEKLGDSALNYNRTVFLAERICGI